MNKISDLLQYPTFKKQQSLAIPSKNLKKKVEIFMHNNMDTNHAQRVRDYQYWGIPNKMSGEGSKRLGRQMGPI